MSQRLGTACAILLRGYFEVESRGRCVPVNSVLPRICRRSAIYVVSGRGCPVLSLESAGLLDDLRLLGTCPCLVGAGFSRMYI